MHEHLIIVRIPLDAQDITAIERLLATAGVFVTTALTITNPYDLREYLAMTAQGNSIRALLDRNLTSRAIRLARGTIIDHDRHDAPAARVAAACMAFLISADIMIEPNISLYETAEQPAAWAHNDLLWFRRANHVRPQAYADFALGRTDRLPDDVREEAIRHVLQCPEPALAFSKRLRHWRSHYCCLLKIALLQREGRLSQPGKLRALLDWSVHEGFFNGTAIAFAVMYFGRHPHANMIKHSNTKDFQRCQKGIKNAAWDLTYLSHWVRRSRQEVAHAWMFCTNDRALAYLGQHLVTDEGDEHHHRLAVVLRHHWPDCHADLVSHYQHCCTEAETMPDRAGVVNERLRHLDDLTMRLEQDLRQTFPAP